MNERIPSVEFSGNDNEKPPYNFEKYREAREFVEEKGYVLTEINVGTSIHRGDTELAIWFSDIAQLKQMAGSALMSSESEEKCTLLKPSAPQEIDTRDFEQQFWDSEDDKPLV